MYMVLLGVGAGANIGGYNVPGIRSVSCEHAGRAA